MSYETEVTVSGLDINESRVQISGWDAIRRGYCVLAIPAEMPTPKLGEKLRITVEVQP